MPVGALLLEIPAIGQVDKAVGELQIGDILPEDYGAVVWDIDVH